MASINFSRRTALYRLFDQEGRLLYVGITFNPSNRWNGHSTDKSWWKEVTRREVKWFETRWAAEAAETAAIRTEAPLYNISGNVQEPVVAPPKQRRAKTLKPDALDDLIAAKVRERNKRKADLEKADAHLKSLLVRGRASGKGPSDMAKLTGFTREWVAKIAPAK